MAPGLSAPPPSHANTFGSEGCSELGGDGGGSQRLEHLERFDAGLVIPAHEGQAPLVGDPLILPNTGRLGGFAFHDESIRFGDALGSIGQFPEHPEPIGEPTR